MWERLVTSCSVFFKDRRFGIQRRTYTGKSLVLRSQAGLKMPCQDKAMTLKAARRDRKLRANDCWGTLRSEERLVASLTATPRSGVRSGAVRTPVVLGTIFTLL